MSDKPEDLLRQLQEEHEALEREHKRLQQETPVDLFIHAAQAEKLRKYKARLHALAEALRNDEPPDVA